MHLKEKSNSPCILIISTLAFEAMQYKYSMQYTDRVFILQVLAIEFILLAIDFVPLANEFVPLAIECRRFDF